MVPVPSGFPVRPVDSRDVATRLTDLALAEPAGRVPDLGGPEVLSFAAVMREYLQASGHGWRKVLPIRLPGTAEARAGGMLPAKDPEPITGQRTWKEFLAETYARG